jgi:hypothetical protein
MKSFKITMIVVVLLAILTSCDHKVAMNTGEEGRSRKVYADLYQTF